LVPEKPANDPGQSSPGGTRQATACEDEESSLRVLRFTSFDTSLVVHGITTRTSSLPLNGNMSYMVGDDVDLIWQNRQAWAEAIGYDPARLVLGRQVHETTIAVVDERHAGSGADSVETALRRVDGLITQSPDLPIGVMAADCVPILLHDPETRSIGAIHAGWRGTVDGIAASAVEAMQTRFGSRPGNLVAGLGPSICGPCYQVGTEVIERWRTSGFANDVDAVSETEDGSYFDLRAANRGQLLLAGLREEKVESSGTCTRCANGTLFSRRGLGPRTGLFTSVIMLRDSESGTAEDEG
jgi:polyphenol oxidase